MKFNQKFNDQEIAVIPTKTTQMGIDESGFTLNGNLAELHENIGDIDDGTVFTDKHTKTMNIQLGVPVLMDRNECNNNPHEECSYGLHVGATKYVE